jgi:hypothetical protein
MKLCWGLRAVFLFCAAHGLAACGDDAGPSSSVLGTDGGADAQAGSGGAQAAGAAGQAGAQNSGGSTSAGGTGGSAGSAGAPASRCAPLPAPTGNVVSVNPTMTGQLQALVAQALPGDTIVFDSGTYELNGAYLWVGTSGVTLRSKSGNPGDVILDGGYSTTEVITVAASQVTVAELSIHRPRTHAIHVVSTDASDTLGTRLYRVSIVDPREQAIKINPHGAKLHFPDSGEIACSRMLLTDTGRPHVNPTAGGCYTGGIDAHAARDWLVRDNHIEGFWCPTGLAEHAIHFWSGTRDIIVERNVMLNNARGVGFGLSNSGEARTYADNPCPAAGTSYVGHYGGIVRNNFVAGTRPELFSSSAGFDTGIMFWAACNPKAIHNTIVATGKLFSAIEWRFPTASGVELTNNLTTHALLERDGASGTQAGNVTSATPAMFADVAAADLHLVPAASTALDPGVAVAAGLCTEDIDGEPRSPTPDVGADEVP